LSSAAGCVGSASAAAGTVDVSSLSAAAGSAADVASLYDI